MQSMTQLFWRDLLSVLAMRTWLPWPLWTPSLTRPSGTCCLRRGTATSRTSTSWTCTSSTPSQDASLSAKCGLGSRKQRADVLPGFIRQEVSKWSQQTYTKVLWQNWSPVRLEHVWPVADPGVPVSSHGWRIRWEEEAFLWHVIMTLRLLIIMTCHDDSHDPCVQARHAATASLTAWAPSTARVWAPRPWGGVTPRTSGWPCSASSKEMCLFQPSGPIRLDSYSYWWIHAMPPP